jgi:DNA polymerase III alpha subunit
MAKLVSVKSMGIQETYDIGVDQYHNYIANNIVVHNCMLLARRLAGFSGSEANALRKGLAKGKDNAETMKKLQKLLKDFRERSQDSVAQGLITQEQLDEFIATLEKFGGYGFNLSHAASYALVAYWSLFLKVYFPVQFMVALLNFTDLAKKDDKGVVVLKKYIQHAKKLGVTIAPPDINTSQNSFSLDGDIIRWGLGMVKGLGPSAAEEVLSKRPYDDFDDLLDKVEKRKLNKSKVMALIKCGAFDKFGDREFLINYYLGNIRKEKGYEFVKFGDEEKQAAEEDLLGMSISFGVMPNDLDYNKLKDYGVLRISDMENNYEGVYLGKVGKIKKTRSKKSDKEMMIVEFADDFDDITFFVWERDIEYCEKTLITGHIMTVPLRKFDLDSDGCFYCGPQKDVLDLSEED